MTRDDGRFSIGSFQKYRLAVLLRTAFGLTFKATISSRRVTELISLLSRCRRIFIDQFHKRLCHFLLLAEATACRLDVRCFL